MPAKTPDPSVIQPIANVETLTFVKPAIKNQTSLWAFSPTSPIRISRVM